MSVTCSGHAYKTLDFLLKEEECYDWAPIISQGCLGRRVLYYEITFRKNYLCVSVLDLTFDNFLIDEAKF